MVKLEYKDFQAYMSDFNSADQSASDYLTLIREDLEFYTDESIELISPIDILLKIVSENLGCTVFPKGADNRCLFESELNDFNQSIKDLLLADKTENEKILIDTLNIDINRIDEVEEDGEYIAYNGIEYLVLTDNEADEAAYESINDSVWAFNTDFIISHSDALDYDNPSRAFIEAIQEQGKGGNEAMKRLINNFDDFVEEAIRVDGRGRFLSTYDSEELENYYNNQWYFIYRTN